MTTMLDKVARALFDAEWGDIRVESEWEGFGKKDYWRASARAALQAIREVGFPLCEKAAEAANDVSPDTYEFYCSEEMYAAGHAALMTAILEEKPE